MCAAENHQIRRWSAYKKWHTLKIHDASHHIVTVCCLQNTQTHRDTFLHMGERHSRTLTDDSASLWQWLGWSGGLKVEGKMSFIHQFVITKDSRETMTFYKWCVCAVFFVGFPRMSAMEFMRAHTIFYPLGWPHVLSYYYICNDKVSLQAMLWHKLSTHFSLENKPRAA